MDGILVIDKPSGPTSHTICREVKRCLSIAKVGHAGTLDPLATGVLILLLGKATRLASSFSGAEKIYQFTMRLGVMTDTYDREGRVVASREVPPGILRKLEEILPRWKGPVEQQVPPYSAVKHKGRPLYLLARRGEVLPLKMRTVTLHSLAIESVSFPEVSLRVQCSAGTYVRSLVHDLGKELGCGAHVTALRRIYSHPFGIEKSVSWPLNAEKMRECLLPLS